PTGYTHFSKEQIAEIKKDVLNTPLLVKQESGVSISCALPYELYVDGNLNRKSGGFELSMQAANQLFGARAAGAPFSVYAKGNYKVTDNQYEHTKNWQYAVSPGDTLKDEWPVDSFESKKYDLELYGPNGFYRHFSGDKEDPFLEANCYYEYSSVDKKAL